MLWLSQLEGSQGVDFYFDIRNIDLRSTGSFSEGVVCGIVGDGCREYWAEIFPGEEQRVDILPFWDESENLVEFEEAVDLHLLKRQLAEAAAKIVTRIGQVTAGESLVQSRLWPVVEVPQTLGQVI